MQYRQYTAGAQATTTTSTMDIRQDDQLAEVVLDLSAIAPADNDTFYAELSWSAQPSPTTNDISNVLASVYFDYQLATSGSGIQSKSINIPCNTKVFQGERLYLHCVNTGTGTTRAYAHVITSKEAPKSASRR